MPYDQETINKRIRKWRELKAKAAKDMKRGIPGAREQYRRASRELERWLSGGE